MFPLFFGPPDELLYGVYHPPEPAVARPLGAVVCQPVLHESEAAHRALRSLADQLARAGVHVLRFDYLGTGDSAGDGRACSLSRWTRDVGLAVEELRAARGVPAVGLVGLRFGATLAARAAAERDDVPFLVLWEPVVRGGPYVESLASLQAAWLAHEARERPGAPGLATAREIIGHPFTQELSEGLVCVDLLAGPAPRSGRILLVDEGAGDDLDALGARLRQGDRTVDHRRIDGGHVWRREFDGQQSQVPRELLADVIDWIGRGTSG